MLIGSVVPGVPLAVLVENLDGSGLGLPGFLRIALTTGVLFAAWGLGSRLVEDFAERSPVQASVFHMVLIATVILGFPHLAGFGHLFPTSQQKALWTYVVLAILGILAGVVAKRYNARRDKPPQG
jgi:hypothetical protein